MKGQISSVVEENFPFLSGGAIDQGSKWSGRERRNGSVMEICGVEGRMEFNDGRRECFELKKQNVVSGGGQWGGGHVWGGKMGRNEIHYLKE